MLLLLFILAPLVELMLLIKVGAMLGPVVTVLIVIGTAIVGSSLARQQGLSVMRRCQAEMRAGRQPTEAMLEGVLVFAAGLVLLLPGFLSDALGILCLIPVTRQKLLAVLKRRLAATGGRGPVGGFHFGGSMGRGPGPGRPGPGATPPDPAVRDLPSDAYEVRRED